MLIWRHICFAMASLIAQFTFKIVNVSQQRFPCICFEKVAIITIYIRFTILPFDLIIFIDSLIFLLLYLAYLSNVFGCNQLNWPWYSKQCSLAPELSQFPFMLSCWCSIVPGITFFFVSPMQSALQLKFNVKTPGQELGISFDWFWHKMDFRLAPNVNTVLMSFFLNSFWSL